MTLPYELHLDIVKVSQHLARMPNVYIRQGC